MKAINRHLFVTGILTAMMIVSSSRAALTLTTLFSFNGTNGSSPLLLIPAEDGSFVGTLLYGINGLGDQNHPGYGGVFRLNADGTLSNLVSFGAAPRNPGVLVRATDGNYYGTLLSDFGALFKMTPTGTWTNLHTFPGYGPDGTVPRELIQGFDGNLYGTTVFDSTYAAGTVFKCATNGNFNTVAQFYGTNGYHGFGLIQSKDGNFYGTTDAGGSDFAGPGTSSGYGTVFKLTPDGVLTSLLSFHGTNGRSPYRLLQGSDDCLYGLTFVDGLGSYAYGSVFKATTNGTLLWSFPFNGTNGILPLFLMQAVDGNLYGTTESGGTPVEPYSSGVGTIFRITPEGIFTSLLSFDITNGIGPNYLIQQPDGNLYGTTERSSSPGYGTIFRLSIPMAPVFQNTTQSNNTLTLNWTSVASQTYQLQFSSDLNSTNWNNLGNPTVATNGTMSASDAIGPDVQRFYRVVLLP